MKTMETVGKKLVHGLCLLGTMVTLSGCYSAEEREMIREAREKAKQEQVAKQQAEEAEAKRKAEQATAEKKHKAEAAAAEKKLIASMPYTLIGKHEQNAAPYSSRDMNSCCLRFDTDGNTNTTEMVFDILMNCHSIAARVWDAKIGEAKTKTEWEKALLSEGVSHCKESWHRGNRLMHTATWYDVR